MEKNLLKTIREAFKIAYKNKLLKESAKDLANKLSPDELEKAESIYPRWISGRLPLRWGKGNLGSGVENYLIEKALDEYKQTRDKKIHDAISTFYYPFERSKVYNRLLMSGRFKSNIIRDLRLKHGQNWLDAYTENLMTAWALSLGNPNKFDEYVSQYTSDSPFGIGPFLVSQLEEKLSSLASGTKAKSKGGGAKGISLDNSEFDSEGNRKFDIPGGIEINNDSELKERMYDLFSEFGEAVSDYFTSKGKVAFATLAKEFFVNGKSLEDIKESYPDLFSNVLQKNMSTMMLNQVLRPDSIKEIASNLGEKHGFPSNWLENLIATKSMSSIKDAYKNVEDIELKEPKALKAKKRDDEIGLTFESFIEKNMDKIIKEVYKRLGK